MLQDFFLTLAIVVTLAAVAEALTEFFIAPLWERRKLDPFWLAYVGAGVTAVLVLLSGQNLLSDYLLADFLPPIVSIWIGRVITALLAGRGSNWVHDFWSARRKAVELQNEQISAYRAGPALFGLKDLEDEG